MNMNDNKNPTKLTDCLNDDGSIDNTKWYMYRRQQRQLQKEEEEEEEHHTKKQKATTAATNNIIMKTPMQRSCFRSNINLYRDENGIISAIGPKSSSWYLTYVLSPAIDNPKFEKKFRRRFRCCYSSFLELLNIVKFDDSFIRWNRNDAAGRSPSPIELLLLGALRYLGRGWTFDDLEESTSISEETHRVFFHSFIKWGSKTGIRIHSIEAVDQLWCTCCALHNMFLHSDGLADRWETGEASDWQGDMGLHNAADINDVHYDRSGMGIGNDFTNEDDSGDEMETNLSEDKSITTSQSTSFQYIRKMNHDSFQEKLINHFDILFQDNKIKWPTRTGTVPPNI